MTDSKYNLSSAERKEWALLLQKVINEARMYGKSKSRLTLGVLEKGLDNLRSFEERHHLGTDEIYYRHPEISVRL